MIQIRYIATLVIFLIYFAIPDTLEIADSNYARKNVLETNSCYKSEYRIYYQETLQCHGQTFLTAESGRCNI